MKKYILTLVASLLLGSAINSAQAQSIYAKGDKLITDAGQLSSNSDVTKEGGGFAALIDGNSSTYCHSNWNSDGLTSGTYQNLTVNIGKPVETIYVYWMNGRDAGQTYYNDFPKDINIYGSNDNTTWTLASQLTGVGGSKGSEEYTSNAIDLGASYSYLRFDIVATHSGRKSGDGVPFFCLKEFQVYEALAGKAITFNIKNNAGQIVASANQTESFGKTITASDIPSTIAKDYCTYTISAPLTVSAESESSVDFSYTFDGPFKVSESAEKAHWYVLKVRQSTNNANNIIYLTNSNTLGVSSSQYASINDAANDNDMFAFIGDPYTGFQIVNKQKPTLYLTDANPPAMKSGEGSKWVIKKNTTREYRQNNNYAAGFTIKLFGDNEKYLNHNETNNTLVYWETENNTHDDGSNIVAYPTEEILQAEIEALLNYKTNDVVFGFSKADKEGLNAEYSQYNTFDELKSFLNKIKSKQIPLKTGYYRIVNPRAFGTNSNSIIASLDKGRYLVVKADGTLGVVEQDEAQTDLSNVFKITVSEDYQTIETQDRYLQYSPVCAAGKGNQKSQILPFAGATDATVSIKLSNSDGTLENHYLLINWENKVSEYTSLSGKENTLQYFLIPAKDITVKMHAVGNDTYATFYAPFAVTLPEGLIAYTAAINEENTSLTLSDVGSIVPAGTPVVLIGTASSYTLAINADDATAAPTNNALTGQYLGNTEVTDELSLGVVDGKVGFYGYKGTISANKARIANNISSSKGYTFSFDNDPTGINNATTGVKVGETIYDLQGRRVKDAKHGIYIINGRKVQVK